MKNRNTRWSLGEGEMLREHEPQANASKPFLASTGQNFYKCFFKKKGENTFLNYCAIPYTQQKNKKNIIAYLIIEM